MLKKYQATVNNHALLFAFIAKEMVAANAEKWLRQGVVRYGLQRGARMAKRAQQDNMPLTVDSYLLYGEWEAPADQVTLAIPAFTPEVNLQNLQCPWFVAWEKRGLVSYGSYYCETVDACLARGFHPDLEMDMTLSRPKGAPYCNFFFRGQSMSEQAQKEYAVNKARLGSRAKMDWNYHTGHLYKTLAEELEKGIGIEQAAPILSRALQQYAEEFGESARQSVLEAISIDYDSLPPYVGIGGEQL